MRRYFNVKITAKVRTPIALNSALHLDAILTAVHPAMHNKEVRPHRYDTKMKKVDQAPLPIMSARASSSWVWIATAAEFPENAYLVTDAITKRWTPEDYNYIQRRINTAKTALRNRIVQFPLVVTKEVYFYAATYDVRELRRLLSRVKNIGGLRKSGYGAVERWAVEIDSEKDFRNYLAANGIARRNLPNVMCKSRSMAYECCHPPYWYIAGKIPAHSVGQPCVLNDAITISGGQGKTYEFSATLPEE